MIQDVFVPSKIGSYYIFSKRVLSFEITTNFVQASLIYFSHRKVILENSMTIVLQDQNPASIINAIKKIATTIGSYDEVVTSLTSSAVVFKELTLPFIGREKIGMIVSYEVEPLLPFSLDDAVIDFLVMYEDKEKSQTTILVAAARKADLDEYISYFQKAQVRLTHVTLDMFALYDFYRHTMYVTQTHASLLLVDFGIDALRILYVQKGILKSVRLIPYGLALMMDKINQSLQFTSNNSAIDFFEKGLHAYDEQTKDQIISKLVVDFSKQISLSISFFQKQIKDFVMPVHVLCLGQVNKLQGFFDQVTEACQINFESVDIKRILSKNSIQVYPKAKFDSQYSGSLIIGLSAAHYGKINFLSHEQKKIYNTLLNKQLLVACMLSCAIIIGLYMYSKYQIQFWDIAYEKSRKELLAVLKDQMNIDLKATKRVTDIVVAAQDKLEQTKKVCFSFSQSNNAFLQHLQDLSTTIDRESVGLELKKMSMQGEQVVLLGKVKNYDALDLFVEELMNLKNLSLKNIPRDLTFTVTLEVKKDANLAKEKL